MGNVVCNGNSITEGGGLTPVQNYPAVLGAALGHDWQVFNCGHALWTTPQLLANFSEVQSHFTKSVTNTLIVNEVSNDIAGGTNEETAKQNMRNLISVGRTNGWRVLFATTTPRTVPASFSAAQQQASENINNFFRNNPLESDGIIDWAANPNLSDPSNATYYQDGVHPTAAGAAVMAQLAQSAL